MILLPTLLLPEPGCVAAIEFGCANCHQKQETGSVACSTREQGWKTPPRTISPSLWSPHCTLCLIATWSAEETAVFIQPVLPHFP